MCVEETTGLIDHSDHRSQYVSVVYNERLAQHGIAASTEAVGDLYANALAENVNGFCKNELIHTRRWDVGVEVETDFLEAEPATGNTRNQGKCLGTKLGALQFTINFSKAILYVAFGWCSRSW
ncbi:hypothetical protein CBE89_10490 [Corynebacterium striatum]|uniref:Transposase n=1 Tax=Corynebacterium striatum TaxID=43770 RepID=A0A2Z2J5P3_CORST|nr:hypothetical protein [Corynebacterium striatum]ART21867.1 hypothetical protein CBE89_10490 [Corynebacterium striatum]